MEVFSNPAYIWLAVGVLVIVLEFFVAPGLGIVFAGMGAIVVGALLEMGVIESVMAQIMSFCAATAVWALILWKPLKGALARKAVGKGGSHIVGTTATAAKGGVNKVAGNAKWSGTIMKARLEEGSALERLEEGKHAEVIDLDGSTLILKAK